MSFSPIYQPYEILGYTVQVITKDLVSDMDSLHGRFQSPVYTVPTYEAAWEKAKQMAKENIPEGGEAVLYTHPMPFRHGHTIDSVDNACVDTHDYYKNSLAAGGNLNIWTRKRGSHSVYANVYIVPVFGKER